MVHEKFQKSVPNFSLIRPNDVFFSKIKFSFQSPLAINDNEKKTENIIFLLKFINNYYFLKLDLEKIISGIS